MLVRLSGRSDSSYSPSYHCVALYATGLLVCVAMGAIKYYFGTVPVPYRLERDLRGTVPRAVRPGRDRDGRGKNVYFSLKKRKSTPCDEKESQPF